MRHSCCRDVFCAPTGAGCTTDPAHTACNPCTTYATSRWPCSVQAGRFIAPVDSYSQRCTYGILLPLQVSEYKYEVERLTRELSGLKQQYYSLKRREQLEKEAAAQQKQQPGALTAAAAAAVAAAARAAAGSPGGAPKAAGGMLAGAVQSQQQRFAGGGFSLSATS